jgi:hypothetical protein
MATIQGIKFENDANGKPISVTIDLEKYSSQLEPFLKQIGILEQKDAFDIEWENSISSEEFLKKSIKNINTLSWKK